MQFRVQDRLEVILNTWVESGYVPSPAEVSKLEGIDFPWSKGEVSSVTFSYLWFSALTNSNVNLKTKD